MFCSGCRPSNDTPHATRRSSTSATARPADASFRTAATPPTPPPTTTTSNSASVTSTLTSDDRYVQLCMGAAQPFTTTGALGFRRVGLVRFSCHRRLACRAGGVAPGVSNCVGRCGRSRCGSSCCSWKSSTASGVCASRRTESYSHRITDVVSVCGLRAVNSTTSRSRVGSVTPRPRTWIAGRSLSMSSRIGTTLIG